jgi:cyclophilin family peptidyl-prolyl cis-trans isomerase
MFLREATKKNPKDKKTSSLYNKLLNEMQEKRISETVIPRMFNNGGPTPAGIFVIFAVFLLALGAITVANTESTTTDYIELNLSWTENGVAKTGTVSLELYPNDAPAHAENFKQLVVQGKYDGTKFHRVIDDFMIQGGDFTNGDGTGGHAGVWLGYCNTPQGGIASSEGDCAQNEWTVPDEADNGYLHEVCTISMAKTGNPNTGGSQFFLIPNDSNDGKGPEWLDGVHTVFGSITDGCDVVTTISNLPTDNGDKPINDVVMESAVFVGQDETDPWYKFW